MAHRFVDKPESPGSPESFILTYMHVDEQRYDEQLQSKVHALTTKFHAFVESHVIDFDKKKMNNDVIDAVVIIKSPTRYRQRCRFSIEVPLTALPCLLIQFL